MHGHPPHAPKKTSCNGHGGGKSVSFFVPAPRICGHGAN